MKERRERDTALGDIDTAEASFDSVHDDMFREACAIAHAKNERQRSAAKKKLRKLADDAVDRAEHFSDVLRASSKRLTVKDAESLSGTSDAREEKRAHERRATLHALGFREGFASARDGIASWLRRRLRKGGLAIRVDAEEWRAIDGKPQPERIDP